MNILLVHQLAVDSSSCVIIIATYSVELANIYYTGKSGYFLCFFLAAELLMWIGLGSSVINLVVITAERYIKVVHPVWHKNHFRPWMAYTGCIISWIVSFVVNFFPALVATNVYDGKCFPVMGFTSLSSAQTYTCLYYILLFQLPITFFVYCYARIFHVIRRQNRIFHQTNPSNTSATCSVPTAAAHHTASRSQSNATRTMSFTVGFFIISWLPNNVYFLYQGVTNVPFSTLIWYGTTFTALFNLCLNPFIYIVGYNDVRKYLASKFWEQGCITIQKIEIRSTNCSRSA
jgi:7 transmembrane receptor (rhodopsin family)